MQVELRTDARNDIFDAASFYATQREGLGDEFIDSVFADLDTLELQAGVHPIVNGCHRKLTTRFPCGIYYLVATHIVDVVAILDCRQNPATRAERLKQE